MTGTYMYTVKIIENRCPHIVIQLQDANWREQWWVMSMLDYDVLCKKYNTQNFCGVELKSLPERGKLINEFDLAFL